MRNKRRRTGERGSNQISDTLDQQQQAIGVRETLQSDQLHQNDASERVIGGDEHAKRAGYGAQRYVAVEDGHQRRHDAAEAHAEGVDDARVHPRTITHPSQEYLESLWLVGRFYRYVTSRECDDFWRFVNVTSRDFDI